jgi:NADH:ubiquinone reductase (H+-translocating)
MGTLWRLVGLFAQALSDLAEHVFGPEAVGVAPVPQQRKQIVILGGGFAGMKTAECLEQELHTSSSAMITPIGETNALLFTPMLAEVAGRTLEPSHISTPLRSSLRRTEFIRGRVNSLAPGFTRWSLRREQYELAIT